ncbi:hypothetical protein M9H77_18344 [Catharanthus roseus]|uniref:Uncharacterized protein n=1 Tax=Catharanthus roseus TaxID=4058 RepID=A0ACC0B771_CATRO|nr:hypothetical protein M9H77_18344 [Catharanthus roseus]
MYGLEAHKSLKSGVFSFLCSPTKQRLQYKFIEHYRRKGRTKMAAASASSASLHLCNNSRFSPSCSKSFKPQYVFLKPISNRPFSLSLSNSLNPMINKSRSRCRCLRASFSGSQATDGNDFPQNEPAESKKIGDLEQSHSLKSIMLAYKEAILDGDEKTISEIEAIICMVEKERDEMAQKVSTLSAEISSGKDKYVRLQADFDNFRKRSEKERLTVRSDAQWEVIEGLLPMVDNFERAKQHIKLETEQEKKIDASYQGIYKQFVEIMRSLRVAVVPTIGKPFDPTLHEAIAREESEEFKEGIVTQEFRRGFLLDGRLLRPAMVKVSSGPGKKQTSSSGPCKSFEQPVSAAGVDER